MPINPSYRYPLLALLLLLVLACAKQGFPPGGPVDRIRPEIIATLPKSDSTGVGIDTRVWIHFSEAVDHRTCEESIFITPLPTEPVHYKWRGSRLEIRFAEPLLENRTYVITVGTGTRDRRNLTMAASHTLAFSTGDSLDRGSIRGTVHADTPIEGTQVWAYDLETQADPDPGKIKPLYVTQCSALGSFNLDYLALGRYRIFAVADRDRSGTYDAERELIAVAPRDILLDAASPRLSGLVLRAALGDTTPPELAGATAPDRHHVSLRFSERLDKAGMEDRANYLIHTAADTLAVLEAFLDFRNAAYVHLLTAPQTAGASYMVHVKQGRDLAGFALVADSSSAVFTGSALDDSLKPYFIQAVPEDKSRNHPLDTPVTLIFSEAMDRLWCESAFVLQDTGKAAIRGRFTWPNAATLRFQPDSLLKPEQLYRVQVAEDSMRDRNGMRLADTLVTIAFHTLNPDTLTEISGSVVDEASGAGKLYLRARAEKGPVYEVWLENEGFYRFAAIMPGRYSIDFYRDEDGNGRFSHGIPFPWQPAERYAVYPDTIVVRSRWPNEGNDLRLPR